MTLGLCQDCGTVGHWYTGKEVVPGNIEAEIVAVLSSLPLLFLLCIRACVTLCLWVYFLVKKSPVILCLLNLCDFGSPCGFPGEKNQLGDSVSP